MPQLNPSPWFAIMFFSWLVFLTIVIPKIMNHSYPNDLSSQDAKAFDYDTWSWPWF
uniref:ATP synthase complex subunit 8 n=1 Tax=Serranus annularis TaxID=2969294 RepID=A0AA96C559_9TELE|nr:ATP synthase F0 subunit 8 [Serranus annularis]